MKKNKVLKDRVVIEINEIELTIYNNLFLRLIFIHFNFKQLNIKDE